VPTLSSSEAAGWPGCRVGVRLGRFVARVLLIAATIAASCTSGPHGEREQGSSLPLGTERDFCDETDWIQLLQDAPNMPASPRAGNEVLFEAWEHSLSIQVSSSYPPFAIHTFSTRAVSIDPWGSATVSVVGGDWRFVGPRDRDRWVDAGRPRLSRLRRREVWRFEASPYDFASLDELVRLRTLRRWSDAPAAIEAAFSEALVSPSQQAVQLLLESVAVLLGTAPVGPDVRKQLLGILAQVPEVSCEGTASDRFGRHGVLLSVEGPQYVSEVVIDPRTAIVLEHRRIAHGQLPFADASPGEFLLRVAFVHPRDGIDL
jgi:hypothetical protein